jgi:hypothetical protein
MTKKKILISKALTVILFFLITYFFIFLFYFFNLEKNFEKNIKNFQNFSVYKKYITSIEHLRYKDEYRYKKLNHELIFNYIKNESDKKIILFQGDSWFHQMNRYEFIKVFLNSELSNFTKIINAGTPSYSPSLMHMQFKIIQKDFNIKPNVLVAYIDQTDMGDELCRYKHLIKYKNGYLESVGAEKYPYYKYVFNLYEKIILSEIEFKNINKILKTQLFVNYKIKKAKEKFKKGFVLKFIDRNKYQKCTWQLIGSYKQKLSEEERNYLKKTFKNYFLYLARQGNLEKIFIVTHPHKMQLVSDKEPINVSEIVAEILEDFPKIQHINFSKIIKENKMIYNKNYENIWYRDLVHLNKENYKIFIKKIVDKIY